MAHSGREIFSIKYGSTITSYVGLGEMKLTVHEVIFQLEYQHKVQIVTSSFINTLLINKIII